MKKFFALHACFLFGVLSGRTAETTNGLTGAKSHYALLGSNKVHYLSLGTGATPIALIHGWSCNAMFWREQAPALTDKAKLIMIDLPGHGMSDKPQTKYTMDFFADAVLAVLQDAHVQKAVLVGHSMGTPVICRAYAKAPQNVAALVAVDGLLRRPRMQADQAEKFVAAYRSPNYREQVTKFFGSMFPNPGTESLRDWTVAEALKTPQYVMSASMDGMFNVNQPDWNPGHVEIPVLVINTKNPMWTPEYEKFVGDLSTKSDYRSIEGAGHFLMLEKPAEFNVALVDGLNKFGLIATKP
jgi:pimeloyl-ACP methyl ester carboxylesterase